MRSLSRKQEESTPIQHHEDASANTAPSSPPQLHHSFGQLPLHAPPIASSSPAPAPVGGLAPGIEQDSADTFIGGKTFGEAVGDIARPVGTTLGNIVGSTVGALTGVSISSTTNAGPTWNDHGHFDWRVGFSTTGANGWIVQEIENTYRAQDDTGADLAGPVPTPHYWEAWAVDGASTITPNVGPNNDYWIRPGHGPNTTGHWSMTGKVFFTTTDPATQGFAAGNAPDAGILLSSTTEPAGLGVARLHRYAQGTWDSTGATPTHTGSAR